MGARLLAFCVWAVVAASAVYWGLLFGSRPVAAPPYTLPVAMAGAPAQADLARVLGREAETPVANAAPVAGPSRFQLVGVVAPKVAGQELGWALIGIDGKPAKAYRQGAVVEGEVVLQSVKHRSATLGPTGQAARYQLEIPPLPPAARGTPANAQPATGAQSATGALLPGRPLALPGLPSALPTGGPGGQSSARPVRALESLPGAMPAVPGLPTPDNAPEQQQLAQPSTGSLPSR